MTFKRKGDSRGKKRYDKKRKKHAPVVTDGNFVAKAVRKFYSDLSDKPNDDPQFCAVHNFATRCMVSNDKLRNLSICQPNKHVQLAQEESQRPPEVRQELFVWFVDIREALKGRLSKRLFKMKAKGIYAKSLEQNETPAK